MNELPLEAAGRVIPNAVDRIRRYCGLPWSGGVGETWAWNFYDTVPTAYDETVTPTDVLTAAALHPGLSRSDLAFFRECSGDVSSWLAALDPELQLCEAEDAVLEHLASLVNFEPDVTTTLLSKVMHRKRPRLVPLIDRHIIDWYRPVIGERTASKAWRPMLEALRFDTARGRLNSAITRVPLERELGFDGTREDCSGLSAIRAIDIAIWMGSR